MKTMQTLLEMLKEAANHASLENADFGKIHPASDKDLISFPTCEKEVTAFIRQRVKLHHNSWIITPINDVIKELESPKQFIVDEESYNDTHYMYTVYKTRLQTLWRQLSHLAVIKLVKNSPDMTNWFDDDGVPK